MKSIVSAQFTIVPSLRTVSSLGKADGLRLPYNLVPRFLEYRSHLQYFYGGHKATFMSWPRMLYGCDHLVPA